VVAILPDLAGAADADPITALRTGARPPRRRRFQPTHRRPHHDELEELGDQFNSMAGQLKETMRGWNQGEERTRDLAQSINELKVLEEVGPRVASSLDLNAVLPTVASRALENHRATPVLIYGYDAAKRQFNMWKPRVDRQIGRGRTSHDRRGQGILSGASASGEPIAIADLPCGGLPMRDAAVEAGFHRSWWCRWSIKRVCWARW